MRYLVALFLSVSLSCGHKVHLKDGIKPQKFPPVNLPKDHPLDIKWEDLKNYVETEGNHTLGAGYIQADVTKFAKKIVDNAAHLIVRLGFDPMELSNEELHLIPGNLKLTNGWVEDLSSIDIIDPVLATYSSETHILDITLPIYFKSFLITYDYKASILLLSVSGNVDAQVSNLKLNLRFGINCTNYHAFVDKASIRDSGSIQVKFTGLGLLDWIIDILMRAVTKLFHGLILDIIDLIIYLPVSTVVGIINNLTESILHPDAMLVL